MEIKWCSKRINNLLKDDRLKTDLNLYTNEHFRNLSFKHYTLPKIKEKVITDNLIKEVLTYKSKNNSQDEVAEILSKKYNIQYTFIKR